MIGRYNMCAIFGSFNFNRFNELAVQNSYRGQHSFSISTFDPTTGELDVKRKLTGPFDSSNMSIEKGVYWIGHIQAPTTDGKSSDYIHPSVIDDSYLWHNGIIKEDCIKYMQAVLGENTPWDTKLLHEWFESGLDLSDVDGTFSCLVHRKRLLYLFRNEISPMFYDEKLNISSVRFDESARTPANAVLKMDFDQMYLHHSESFTTKENPYYFKDGA